MCGMFERGHFFTPMQYANVENVQHACNCHFYLFFVQIAKIITPMLRSGLASLDLRSATIDRII